jgi:DNA gyrase subunit A
VCLVSDDDDVILISSDGIVIRIPASQINTNSRTSKGVRVMKVTPGEAVVSAAPIAREEEDADAGDNTETADGQSEEI